MSSINPNQISIRVEATGVIVADIKSRYGYHSADKPPFIPELDAAGIIEDIGFKVKKFKVDQRVIAFAKTGLYGKYMVTDENLAFFTPGKY